MHCTKESLSVMAGVPTSDALPPVAMLTTRLCYLYLHDKCDSDWSMISFYGIILKLANYSKLQYP